MNEYKSFLIEVKEKYEQEINALKHKPLTATQICKKLQALFPSRAFDKFFILRGLIYITELELSDVSPIMGWSGLGGELNDERVDKLVKLPK